MGASFIYINYIVLNGPWLNSIYLFWVQPKLYGLATDGGILGFRANSEKITD